MSQLNSDIPKYPHAFFKWYCRKDKYEELHGDLEEFFYYRMEEEGLKYARRKYLLDVIRCCQPYAWKDFFGQTHSKFNQIIMLKNYFKTSMRSMMRNPLSSFINVFGISVAIGICLIVYAFIDQDIGIDQFHKNKHEVFLATAYANQEGELLQYGQTPAPLGVMLSQDFPQVRSSCRVLDVNTVVKFEDKVFHERIRLTDPTFLDMLTFPMQWGSQSTLNDPNSIILSDDMSVKYFGDLNPVGRDLLVKLNDEVSKTFTITGVAAPFPKSHAIEFDFLINYDNITQFNPSVDPFDWNQSIAATLVRMDIPSNIEQVRRQMDKYKDLQNQSNPDRPIEKFAFVSLADLHMASNDIINGISFGTRKEGWVILSIMASFVLVLACFNYINIAIVSAAKRLKEIGVRKVIGANRGLVIFQFLAENMLITLFAILIGLLLAYFSFIPWFNNLFGRGLELTMTDPNLWLFLFAMLIGTGFVSGTYPAFYISRIQIVRIFRGSVQLGKKNPLTKIFLTFQLILAFIAISGGVWFTQNNAYQRDRDWGYEQTRSMYVDVPDRSGFEKLYALFEQNPNVQSISGSAQHLGHGNPTVTVSLPDRDYEVGQMAVGANYFETMGLEIVSGRSFFPNATSDANSIIVNQEFVKSLTLEDAIGKVVKVDSLRFEIVGVVKNFHVRDFDFKIRPTFFSLADDDQFRFLSIKVEEGTRSEVYDFMREQWMEVFPSTPFRGGYQSGVFNGYFDYLDSSAEFMRSLALVTIILATLGLYGLITLNISGRIREFSIRKVLGAKLKHVTVLLARQYLWLVLTAILIGAPAGYFLVETLFDTVFAYHMPMNYSGLVVSVTLLIAVLLFTIYTQVRKLANTNPSQGLKVE